jgi:hypothetical protein
MQMAVWLAIAVALSTAGATEPIVLENAGSEPFVYHFHHGFRRGQEIPWTAPLAVPPGERRTIAAAVPLVIGFHDQADWKEFTVVPGNHYRVRRDAQARPMLYLSGAAQSLPLRREVKVLVVADAEYRVRFPEWQERLRGLIEAASRCYECEFGIRFRPVGFKPWNFNARRYRSMDAKLASLAQIELGPADLMVAFIRSVQDIGGGTAIGWGQRLSQYALVTDSWPELAEIIPLAYREKIWKEPGFGSTVTLVHELGHTLAGFHLANLDSIMCPNPSKTIPPRIQFDEVTRKVIQATAGVDFRRGPDSIPRDWALRIRELYRSYHVASEPADGDPITGAYRDRANQAQLSQNQALATEMTERAETWWRVSSGTRQAVVYPHGSFGPGAEQVLRVVPTAGWAAAGGP